MWIPEFAAFRTNFDSESVTTETMYWKEQFF